MSDSEDLKRMLEERWESLEGAATGAVLRTEDIPIDTAYGPVLLGAANDGRRVLVPLAPNEHRSMKDDRRSAGVHLLRHALDDDAGIQWHAELVCRQPRLNDVFVSLVVDLLLRIELLQNDPIRAMRRCLSEWRALLVSGGRFMSPRELAGLCGELLILEDLIGLSADAIPLWRGPLNEPHDFLSGNQAVEVKTGLAQDGHVIHVNGLGQLTAPVGGRLLLAHLRLSQVVDGGFSVPDVVERLGKRCDESSLRGRLEAGGYREDHSEAYSRILFQEMERRWFEVDEDFPSISADSFADGIPPGVGAVQYELDLAATGRTSADPDLVAEHLQLMAVRS